MTGACRLAANARRANNRFEPLACLSTTIMETPLSLTVAVAAIATAIIGTMSAATLYVSLDSPNPTPP
jgi:hypothetical protein